MNAMYTIKHMQEELARIKEKLSLPVKIQNVNIDWLTTKNVQLDILRLDLLHPIINGNKWCKLIKHLEDIDLDTIRGIVSCGGEYSNHLHVIGYISYLLNLECHAIVREGSRSSMMLEDLSRWDVNILTCSREQYRERYSVNWWEQQIQGLEKKQYIIIPEGGSGQKAVHGTYSFFKEILSNNHYDEVLLSLGTGGTFAGVVASAPSTTSVTGISVLKKFDLQLSNIRKWLLPYKVKSKYKITSNSPPSAYAKISRELLIFLEEWYNRTGIPIEPIYTGKMFFYIYNNIKLNLWPDNTRLLAIHTGGLQGIRGQKELFCRLGHYALWEKLYEHYSSDFV